MVKQPLPVWWHAISGSGCALLDWAGCGRGHRWPLEHLIGAEVVKPSFTRLEAGDDGVARFLEVAAGMLVWAAVATTNMAALGAAAQVKPPAVGCC